MVENDLLGSGYTCNEVMKGLTAIFMVEEEYVTETSQGNVQFHTSSYQQENERQQTPVETPKFPSDVVHGIVPTPLPLLESTHRRTLKCIQVEEVLIISLEGVLSKRVVSYQT